MKTVKVLLVDDNPLVLDLITRGMEPHCEVIPVNDGADALLRVIDSPPDLIISDYKIPGMDGRQLFEKLRSRETTRNIPFIFVAARADIEEKLKPLGSGVEDFIQKPFFIEEFVQKAKKVVDRLHLEKLSKRASRPGVIQGRIEEMSIIDLLQSLEMAQKSCRLTLRRDAKEVQLFFTSGACKHATFGKTQGDEAVYEVVKWNDGEFEIDFNTTSDKITTTRSTQGLLMEGLRLIDEANAAAADSKA